MLTELLGRGLWGLAGAVTDLMSPSGGAKSGRPVWLNVSSERFCSTTCLRTSEMCKVESHCGGNPREIDREIEQIGLERLMLIRGIEPELNNPCDRGHSRGSGPPRGSKEFRPIDRPKGHQPVNPLNRVLRGGQFEIRQLVQKALYIFL